MNVRNELALKSASASVGSEDIQTKRHERNGMVSIYQINLWNLEFALFITAVTLLVLLWSMRGPFFIDDGGLRSIFRSIGLAALSFLVIGVFLAMFLSRLVDNWAYTSWNRNRIPYIQLTNDSIRLFGDISIPWSSISSIDHVDFYARGYYVIYVVFRIPVELRRQYRSSPHFEWLIRYNNEARHLYRRESNIDLDPTELFTLELETQNGLTLPNGKIVDLIKSLWSSSELLSGRGLAGGSGAHECDMVSQYKIRFKLDWTVVYRACLVTGMCVFMLSKLVPSLSVEFHKENDRRNWPTVTGKIAASSVAEGCANPLENRPTVNYTYTVNGVNYVGTKIDAKDLDLKEQVRIDPRTSTDFPINGNRCVSRNSALHLVSRYPTGSIVNTYFNPSKPQESFLAPSGLAFTTLAGIAAVIAEIVGLAFVALIYLRIAIFD